MSEPAPESASQAGVDSIEELIARAAHIKELTAELHAPLGRAIEGRDRYVRPRTDAEFSLNAIAYRYGGNVAPEDRLVKEPVTRERPFRVVEYEFGIHDLVFHLFSRPVSTDHEGQPRRWWEIDDGPPYINYVGSDGPHQPLRWKLQVYPYSFLSLEVVRFDRADDATVLWPPEPPEPTISDVGGTGVGMH
jgi:hypothetical protein